jgi:hypothetical protein
MYEQRGKSLTFQLHSEPVGELQQLEVTHFGTSKHSSWQLKGIVVSYVTTAGESSGGNLSINSETPITVDEKLFPTLIAYYALLRLSDL